MLRTASAKPCPEAAPERVGRTPEDRAGGSEGAEDGAVIPAGTSTTVASSLKSGIPRTRARIDAWARVPSDKRLLRSGAAVNSTGAVAPTVWGAMGNELFEWLSLHPVVDLSIALMPGLQADHEPSSENPPPG